MSSPARSPRFTFVLEQTLGHVAFGRNLRTAVEGDGVVEADWIEVAPRVESPWERTPLGRNWSVRAALKARLAVERRRRRRGPPDAYFFHTQVAAMLSSGLLPDRRPLVVSLDATPLAFDRLAASYGHAVGNPAAEAAKRCVNRRVLRCAAHVVVWSEWARRSVVDDYGIAPQAVSVIPPGLPLDLWRRGPAAVADAAADRGNRRVRLLFVGGDFTRKGGKLLTEVFRTELADRCELHVVTKAADVPATDDIVVHTGVEPNSDRLRRLMHWADVFVLPTYGDVFGIACQEAMAAGLPVVATHVGAVPEVVADGETGLLVPPGDGRALADAIRALVGDEALRRRMGERGSERAGARFDARVNAGRILDVLRSACGAPAGAGTGTSSGAPAADSAP